MFIVRYVRSILSLIKIYFKTKNKKKNLIFYFPVKIYQTNLIEITKYLQKKYNIFLIYNSHTENEIFKEKNSLFIDFNILRFIKLDKFFLKYITHFFSSYISYVYPPNSINSYISHDIYDAPMINTISEKKLFSKINELDNIFVSSNISKNYFLKKFKTYNLHQNPKLFNTGYLKLDHLIKIIKKKKYKKNKKKTILIAPGYFYAFKKYNMMQKIIEIIEILLKKKELNIIFRPHPLDLTRKGNFDLINKIKIKFRNYENFKLDNQISYLNSFIYSDFMITDLSSTAYTYSFSTLKPVLFFSNNEKKLKKQFFFKTNYFSDRIKIGLICNNIKLLPHLIMKLLSKKNSLKKKIFNLRSKKIQNLYLSKQKTLETIHKIILINH
jgi:hypothetical protein